MTDLGPVLFEALNLMLLGMVVVFAFLSLLIILMSIMSRLALKHFPEQPVSPNKPRSAPNSGVPANVIAAITAAVHQYRNKNNS